MEFFITNIFFILYYGLISNHLTKLSNKMEIAATTITEQNLNHLIRTPTVLHYATDLSLKSVQI